MIECSGSLQGMCVDIGLIGARGSYVTFVGDVPKGPARMTADSLLKCSERYSTWRLTNALAFQI